MVHPSQGGRASVMRGGRGAEAAKMLVADLDAIGFATRRWLLEAELPFYGQVLGFHPQQTRHLREHGHARLIIRMGPPAPHSKENGRELSRTRRVQLKNKRTAHLA
ncbi:hypothetical protein FBY34_8702 [Streptomyces sp. SLBN-115]|nr:hypothetical protein FBY34_8702 [Streptomyces sp. SLBN-115]